MKTSLILAVLLLTSLAAPVAAGSFPIVAGEAGVTDGDTIRMARATITVDGRTQELSSVRIRFHGIDAPEKGQTCGDNHGNAWSCGQDATKVLAEIVHGNIVTCSVRDIDRYKRLVAVCSVPGIADINAELVTLGLAVAYRDYSFDYVDEEDAARAAHAGMWAGAFDMPWDWRKAH